MAAATSVEERVLDALSGVLDPEVDEPITEMGFVRRVEVAEDGGVDVTLQLPTYFCAPNFTWLMVADVRDAAERVVGEGRVGVRLEDHFEGHRIAGAVSRGQTFTQAFGAEAAAELDQLRDRFRRKAFLVRQERLCQELDVDDPVELAALRLRDVARLGLASYAAYLGAREELGIDCRHNSPLLVAADGRPVGPAGVRAHRRAATVMAVSFEGNGHLCRALLSRRVVDSPDRAVPHLHQITHQNPGGAVA